LIDTNLKVLIYGGNGFVGTHVARRLAYADGVCVACLSRSGHKPTYLKKYTWSENIRWTKGDASQPDQALLQKTDVLISLVGAAPLPTFSKAAYEQQLFANGTSNINLINTAREAGIKRLILVGASIPWIMRSDMFAYAKGKQLSLEAAKEFATTSDQHQALVLQPGAIYGKRRLTNGKVIPLDLFMKPMSWVMPSHFTDLNKISERIANAVTHSESHAKGLTVLGPKEI